MQIVAGEFAETLMRQWVQGAEVSVFSVKDGCWTHGKKSLRLSREWRAIMVIYQRLTVTAFCVAVLFF